MDEQGKSHGDASNTTTIDAVSARKEPPPESSSAVWTRRAVLSSFWLVVVFLGLPIWWKTTTIYRASLPLSVMNDWADGKTCRPVFPLRIAVDAPSLNSQDASNLVRTTQHALDDLNDFPAHHLRLQLLDSRQGPNASQKVDTPTDGETLSQWAAQDEDIALTVRLWPGASGTALRAELRAYSPVLDIIYATNQIPSSSSTSSPLATFIANELQSVFFEEQAQLAYLLSTTNQANSGPTKSPLSAETAATLSRQANRAFKYAPTYHLTFSLFTPTASPSAWQIERALQEYISPLLYSLSSISNFTVDTQVQLYAQFAPSIREPEYDADRAVWTLNKEDLSGFINAAEWPLSPSIGVGPTVNFVLYVPSSKQTPLVVKENHGNSWLIPQWGGVYILNPPEVNAKNNAETLTLKDLEPPFFIFSTQLLSLLGVPQTPASLPLRLSTLVRVRAASLLFSASSTLGSLARLTLALPSIAIPDMVADSVDQTIAHLHEACNDLRDGRFHRALSNARIAEAGAEKAFFERSMVGQVYFPDEHKVAVYLPLLGPVAVPLVMAGLKEIKKLTAKSKPPSQ